MKGHTYPVMWVPKITIDDLNQEDWRVEHLLVYRFPDIRVRGKVKDDFRHMWE